MKGKTAKEKPSDRRDWLDYFRVTPYPYGRRPTEKDISNAESNRDRYELISDQCEWDERER